MAKYDMGTAEGRIRTTYDNKGVKSAKKDLRSLKKDADDTEKSFKKVGVTSGAASALIASGLIYAANKAIDFQKQISAIGAVSGASNDDLEALRKKALQLGADTTFSASEAASAMEELAKAGVSTKDILNGAADAAVALAAAGGIDLAQAAEIAANAMGQFNLQAKDLAHVVDLIAGAANASAISVDDFNESMKQAGAVANLAGLKFDDLAVAIALMGKNGIKGSDAGTSLKTMLMNLQPQTKKQIELFKELGIITKDGSNAFYDAHGNLKSLADISEVLNRATAKMTAQQKSATLEILFGSDAIRAAAILTKNGAKGFNEMAAAMGKVKAADVAAARLDNVAGSIEQLKGSLETAAITIGTLFLPVIRKITDWINKLVNKFNALDPRWQKLIGFAAAGAAALLAVISALAGVGAIIAGVGASLAAIKIAAIIAAIVAAVTVLIVALKELWNRSEAFRNAVGTIFKVLKHHFEETVKIAQPFVAFIRDELIPSLRDGLRKAIDKMKPAFDSISKFFKDKVAPALAEFRAAIVEATPTILKIARWIKDHLVNALIAMGAILGKVIPVIMKVAGVVFPALIKVIAFLIRNIPTFVAHIKKAIEILKFIGKIIAVVVIGPLYLLWKAVQFVFNGIKWALGALYGAWQKIWGFFGPIVKAVFDLIGSVIGAAMSAIKAVISVAWTAIKAVFETVMNAIWAVVKPIWEAIKSVVEWAMGYIVPFVLDAWAKIQDAFWAAVNFIGPIVGGFLDWLKNIWNTVFGWVSDFISRTWESIKEIFSLGVSKITAVIEGIRKIVDRVKAFFDQLKGAADGGTGTLIAFVKEIPGKVLDAIGNLGSLLYDKGKALIQGLINGIGDMLGKLKDKMKSVASSITDYLPGSPAKEGPLSGQGYVMIRGQHLVEDFALGIARQATDAQRAVQRMVDSMAMGLPDGANATAVQAGTATAAASLSGTSVATATRPTVSAPVTISNLNITGIWDPTDPLASRKLAKEVDDALTKYRKGYK